jgi:signal transduction histidine kinase
VSEGTGGGGRRASAADERRRRLRHDLRTPLTIVAGFAEVLAGDRSITDADRREYASRIHAAAVEIGEIVDAILEEPPRDGGPPQA